jgi:HSP20 family protein
MDMAQRDQQSEQRSAAPGATGSSTSGTGTSGAGTTETGAGNASSATGTGGETERAIPVSGEAGGRGTRTQEQSGRGDRERSNRGETGMARRRPAGVPLSPWALMRQLMDNDLQRLLGFSPTPSNVASPTASGANAGTASSPAVSGAWIPDVEVIQRPNDILVRVDLPGMQADEIDVSVEDGVLAISGEREQERRDNDEGYVRTERVYGQFYRSIPLPEGADPERVEAQFRNGVLEITVPVSRREGHRVNVRG